MNISIPKLKTLYAKRGGVWQPVNLFGVRNEENQKVDVFNDIIGVATGDILYTFPGTTDPGREATEKKDGGAAHLCLGYHDSIWQIGIHGKANPAFSHEAFVQTGSVCKIWRDKDRDFTHDEDDPVETGLFWINLHRASIKGSEHIGPYSYGCQVLKDPQHLLIMLGLAKQSGMKRFSYMLFDKSEV